MSFDYSQAKEHLVEMNACDRCIGRQFRNLFHGFENPVIGQAVRASDSIESAKSVLGNGEPLLFKECPLCHGLFFNVPEAIEQALELIENYDFDSFLVGKFSMLFSLSFLLLVFIGAGNLDS